MHPERSVLRFAAVSSAGSEPRRIRSALTPASRTTGWPGNLKPWRISERGGYWHSRRWYARLRPAPQLPTAQPLSVGRNESANHSFRSRFPRRWNRLLGPRCQTSTGPPPARSRFLLSERLATHYRPGTNWLQVTSSLNAVTWTCPSRPPPPVALEQHCPRPARTQVNSSTSTRTIIRRRRSLRHRYCPPSGPTDWSLPPAPAHNVRTYERSRLTGRLRRRRVIRRSGAKSQPPWSVAEEREPDASPHGRAAVEEPAVPLRP